MYTHSVSANSHSENYGSLSISQMISEAVYQIVVRIEACLKV